MQNPKALAHWQGPKSAWARANVKVKCLFSISNLPCVVSESKRMNTHMPGKKSRGTYCSFVWIRALHQTQPTSVMTQHHWSTSLDNQKSVILLSLLKCAVHKDMSLCFTHRLSDKREPNANASSRLELCQFSDRFWETWSAEINKLITLSRLRIILTCDIHCNILCDEIMSLEINPYSR